jgi:dolichol-phosphate mannosyltransferase
MKYTKPIPPLLPLQTRSVTIVIAAKNEAGNIQSLLSAIKETFEKLNFTLPVILINDGSTDNSREILEEISPSYKFLRIIHHSRSQGLTQCLQTAILQTDTDWVYMSPADLESDIRIDLPILLENCRIGVDGVAGWRQGRKDGKTFASAIANLTCRLTFGLNIHDMNWIKLVRRDILTTLPLQRVTHAYFLAVLSGLGYKIIECPTPWFYRKAGCSKFGRKRLFTAATKFISLFWWFNTTYRFNLGVLTNGQRAIRKDISAS